MKEEKTVYSGQTVRVLRCNTAVVGTGASGYNAADRLWQLGNRDILIVTENRTGGTSRNTGSDKQTYYKLTLSGGEPDSVRELAQTLFDGQCVDGDLALCEAALSAQCFLRLAELGVPFPRNRYGEYVGYKTDHDPRRRATSVGPYTSREMTERLEAAVMAKGIPILDHAQVIRLLSDGERIYGLLCFDGRQAPGTQFLLVRCKNVIYATGGPAGMYAHSVYPLGHYGATGLALEAGAVGKNLTEWQYGLASVKPRWNVSGTYMQVLPRVYSTAPDGTGEREFLLEHFDRPADMLSLLFLKGYQWPFDVEKAAGGSSVLDLLVYSESSQGRRVFLDYRRNPDWGDFRFQDLLPEAYQYLCQAGACFGTPLQRLEHMNRPAVDFYRDRGVDLASEPLEIALCAQHNNGGLGIDCWWQTNVEGLFAVGEAAASHGVYRPGGAALNAGQVGGVRAAQYICARRLGPPEESDTAEALARQAVAEMAALAEQCLSGRGSVDVTALWQEAARQMSLCAAAVRDRQRLGALRLQAERWLSELPALVTAKPAQLGQVFRLRDMLLSQRAYLGAMENYLEAGGGSRGSALYTDPAGRKPSPGLPDALAFRLDGGGMGARVQEVTAGPEGLRFRWRTVRPIPQTEDFFENVWRSYRETGNVD